MPLQLYKWTILPTYTCIWYTNTCHYYISLRFQSKQTKIKASLQQIWLIITMCLTNNSLLVKALSHFSQINSPCSLGKIESDLMSKSWESSSIFILLRILDAANPGLVWISFLWAKTVLRLSKITWQVKHLCSAFLNSSSC